MNILSGKQKVSLQVDEQETTRFIIDSDIDNVILLEKLEYNFKQSIGIFKYAQLDNEGNWVEYNNDYHNAGQQYSHIDRKCTDYEMQVMNLIKQLKEKL